ncbi:MAG: ATP-binding protein [Polyangiales bacterium]
MGTRPRLTSEAGFSVRVASAPPIGNNGLGSVCWLGGGSGRGTVRFSFEQFELDTERRELRCSGERVRVDPLVVDLLGCLVAHGGELVTYEQLIAEVWQGRAVADNVISVSMAKLRRALGQHDDGEPYVLNVYGRGYRFVPKVSRMGEGAPLERPTPATQSVTGPPFVGRHAVLAELRAALREAASSRGKLCVLIGEPGIGKTRTVEALEQKPENASAPFAWARMRALEGAPPLWPMVQALREVLTRVTPARAAQSLGPSYAELGRILPELSRTQADVRDAAARYRTYDAVLRLLALAGEAGPCVLVLDDLQDSDEGSLELLAYLTPELGRLPLLLLATMRSGERPEHAGSRSRLGYVLGHRNCARIELGRLSAQEVASYTEQLLGRCEPALAQAVFDKSEGNPFLMSELLRRARESSGGVPVALTLPGPALELMRQRVRKLDEQARGLLSCAALIGRSFDLGLLGAVTDQSVPRMLEQLEDALATDVIVAAHDDPNRFAFAHELMREVLCEALSAAVQRKLRLRIGETLERRRKLGAEVRAAELAHHFLAALPEGDTERALRYAVLAAEDASAALAYADAAEFLRRALAALDLLPDPSPRMRCDLLCQLAVHVRPCDVPAAVHALERAAAIAREHSFGDVLAFAGIVMSPGPGVVANSGADRALEDALRTLSQGQIYERARVLAHLSWTGPNCFDRERSGELVAEAYEQARASGSQNALIDALWAKLHLRAGPERSDAETHRLIAEVSRLCASEPHHARARSAFELGMFRAVHATQRGDRAGVNLALQALDRTAEEFPYVELSWHHRRLQVVDRMNRGELLGIEPELRALREEGAHYRLLAQEMISGYDLLVWVMQTVVIGQVPEHWLGPARPDSGDPPNMLALKLRTQLELGRSEAARAILADFASRGLRRLPCDRDYLGTLTHLAAAAAALGEHEHAKTLHELLAPYADYFAADISLHCRGSIAHWLGLLDRSLGRLPNAVASLERAVRNNDTFGLLPRAVESRYELALILSQLSDPASHQRAATLCAQASTAASSMGMRPLLEKLQRLTAQLTEAKAS